MHQESPSLRLVKELLDNLPRKYADNKMELIHHHGYLMGVLAHLVEDDFYAEAVVKRRLKQLQEDRRKK